MSEKKCDDIFFLESEIDPQCSPDIIEDWFIQLKSQIALANTPERLMCIIDIAKKAEEKCQSYPLTKNFIETACNNVVDTAKNKLQIIKTHGREKRKKKNHNVLTFSSGKRHSALEIVEKRTEEQRLKNLWI